MRVLEKTLQEVIDAIELIREERDTVFNPAVLLISGFILVSAVVYSSNFVLMIAYLIVGLVLPPFTRINAFRLYKLLIFSLIFLFIISISALLDPRLIVVDLDLVFFRYSVLLPFWFVFLLRVTSSLVVFEVVIAYLGIRNLAVALNMLRVPRKLVFLIVFFTYSIPLFLRRMVVKLLARYSRILKSGIKREWMVIGSIVGDLFLESIVSSKRYALGLRSRGFDLDKFDIGYHNVSFMDALLIFVSIFCLVLALH